MRAVAKQVKSSTKAAEPFSSSTNEISKRLLRRAVTEREAEVLKVMLKGIVAPSDVARKLHRTSSTISTQQASIKNNIGCTTIEEAVEWARANKDTWNTSAVLVRDIYAKRVKRLSELDKRIVRFVGKGMSNRGIAYALDQTLEIAKFHVNKVLLIMKMKRNQLETYASTHPWYFKYRKTRTELGGA